MDIRKSPFEYSIEDLNRELIARSALVPEEQRFNFDDPEGTQKRDEVMMRMKEFYINAPPPSKDLADLSTWDLSRLLVMKTRSDISFTRGAWGDTMLDWYEISDHSVKRNVSCVGAMFRVNALQDLNNGFWMAKVKNYGKTFNLWEIEPFRDQPVASGNMNTCFLAAKDIVVTAGHCVDESELTDLRVIFGFKMLDMSTPNIRFMEEDIYKGVEIIGRQHISDAADWAMIKLDREVEGPTGVKLSKSDVFYNQEVYTIGHPLGLPLKYVTPSYVCDASHSCCFTANLNIYSGDSGSPVFDCQTHKVVGLVVRGDNRDFRWTGNGWGSIGYPGEKGTDCTRVTQFIDLLLKHK